MSTSRSTFKSSKNFPSQLVVPQRRNRSLVRFFQCKVLFHCHFQLAALNWNFEKFQFSSAICLLSPRNHRAPVDFWALLRRLWKQHGGAHKSRRKFGRYSIRTSRSVVKFRWCSVKNRRSFGFTALRSTKWHSCSGVKAVLQYFFVWAIMRTGLHTWNRYLSAGCILSVCRMHIAWSFLYFRVTLARIRSVAFWLYFKYEKKNVQSAIDQAPPPLVTPQWRQIFGETLSIFSTLFSHASSIAHTNDREIWSEQTSNNKAPSRQQAHRVRTMSKENEMQTKTKIIWMWRTLQVDALDKAKLDLIGVFAINSLFWSKCASGVVCIAVGYAQTHAAVWVATFSEHWYILTRSSAQGNCSAKSQVAYVLSQDKERNMVANWPAKLLVLCLI